MDVIDIIRKHCLLRGLSPKTIKTYGCTANKFLKYHGKPVNQITQNDIRNYLLNLIEDGSPGNTINVYLNALKFFFEECLRKKLTVSIRYSKVPKTLPEFLTQEEIKRFFACLKNKKHKLMLTLIYSAGLRVSELLNLKTKDLDLEESYGWVRQGKGNKDRPFIIAETLKKELINWITDNRLKMNDWLFSNCHNNKMSSQTIRMVIKKLIKQAKINKNVHPHTLRHSFATHLLENGYAVTDVQSLLGHSKIETTLVYTHLAKPKLLKTQSPLDGLLE